METVRIHRLTDLPDRMRQAIRAGQIEAGRLWTDCMRFHRERRTAGSPWPDRVDMHYFTKGRYALHSQTVQQIAHQLLANVDATTERRRKEPKSRAWLKYPHKEKRFFPLYWPRQAVSYDKETGRLVLPMGRGRRSLVFRLDLDFVPGAAKLVWKEGCELHLVRADVEQAKEPPGPNKATVDLGEIHLAAAVTDTGEALVVSGRGIRADKRLLMKQLGELNRKRSRCVKGSRRWRRLQQARMKRSLLTRRRVRDRRHKATRAVIKFCADHGVGTLFVGDPRGVRKKRCGRRHNQRVALWEVGTDIKYLGHKAERARIACFTGDERGTSSRCPRCGHRHKPRGREWRCRKCAFAGHRDLVGAVNMHEKAFSAKVTFPASVTYLRPGPARVSGRSSSLDTGPREAVRPSAPRLLGTAPPQGGASRRREAAGSPVRRKALPSSA